MLGESRANVQKKIQKKPEEIPRIFWRDVRVRFGKNFCNRSCAIWPDCSERLAKKFGKKIQKKIRCAVSLKIRGGCRFFFGRQPEIFFWPVRTERLEFFTACTIFFSPIYTKHPCFPRHPEKSDVVFLNFTA